MRSLAIRPVLVVLVAKSALNLAFAGRYGWQRDELYYAVAGRHLQGGYVEFPPVTALFAAVGRALFGDSLYGLRLFTILAGAALIVAAALVVLELGGSARAQTLAAVLVGFSPLLIASNGLFQPVSFDQLTTMLLLLVALRIARGHGSWLLLGVAAGIGLETKYTLVVPLAILIVASLLLSRATLEPRGLALAAAVALLLMVPNLLWQLDHGWASVHFFVNPPPSATDESRPQFIGNMLIVTGLLSVPVVIAGLRLLLRERVLRPFGWTVIGTVLAYFVLGGKSYYALPVVLFALAVGALPLDRWATRRRLRSAAVPFALLLVVLLPVGLPVLPLKTADKLGIIRARTDFADEVGWHRLAADVGRVAGGADVVVASNYGEAGALILFGRGLPPVASGDVTFRYWRPDVRGRRAVVVGFLRRDARFCTGWHAVAHIEMPVKNQERGLPIARCTLVASLAEVWPQIVR